VPAITPRPTLPRTGSAHVTRVEQFLAVGGRWKNERVLEPGTEARGRPGDVDRAVVRRDVPVPVSSARFN